MWSQARREVEDLTNGHWKALWTALLESGGSLQERLDI
jgi:hypothetical protein